MFSFLIFLISLQTTKSRLLCCKCDLWLADQCWVAPVEFVACNVSSFFYPSAIFPATVVGSQFTQFSQPDSITKASFFLSFFKQSF